MMIEITRSQAAAILDRVQADQGNRCWEIGRQNAISELMNSVRRLPCSEVPCSDRGKGAVNLAPALPVVDGMIVYPAAWRRCRTISTSEVLGAKAEVAGEEPDHD